MKLRIGLLVLALVLCVSHPVLATKVNKADLEATHILLGRVDAVESFYGVNDRGDQIILSRVKVKALKWIKGEPSAEVDFLVEGGSVGDIALRVSDVPEFEKGQRMRLLLKQENGEFKYEDSEIEEDVRVKRAKPAAGCCKTYAAWQTTPVSFEINSANADGSDQAAANDVQAGADAWGGILAKAGTTGSSTVAPDGHNIVFFRDASSGGAIAVTYLWYNKRTQVMIEFDMYFFETAWTFYNRTAGETCTQGFYHQTIATHEFGHAIGIDHNRCPDSMMYPYASYCKTNGLTAADLACKNKLYQ